MSELIRLEQKRNEKYKTIYLEVAENPELSWKAKGLHLYLTSRPPGWELRYNDLLNRAKDSKTSLGTAIKELKEAGYLVTEIVKDELKKFAGSKWTISETSTKDEPYPRKPEHGKPVVRKIRSTENKGHSSKQVLEDNKVPSIKQTTSFDKPKMDKESLNLLTEHYASIREARPRGKAWLPIQQGFKQMVMDEGYEVVQVIGCMDRLKLLGWTWTINTVRKWIADYAAGTMPENNSTGLKQDSRGETYKRDAGDYADAFKKVVS